MLAAVRLTAVEVFTFSALTLFLLGELVRHGGDGVVSGDKQVFVAELERQHGQRLGRFLASRLRHATADVEARGEGTPSETEIRIGKK
jgi:hypothetical protein